MNYSRCEPRLRGQRNVLISLTQLMRANTAQYDSSKIACCRHTGSDAEAAKQKPQLLEQELRNVDMAFQEERKIRTTGDCSSTANHWSVANPELHDTPCMSGCSRRDCTGCCRNRW